MRRFAPYRHPSVRKFFHWQYSGWFTALFFSAAVGLAIDHRYTLAYTAFCIAALWSMCFWFTGDFLEEKRKRLETKTVRKNSDEFAREARNLLTWTGIGLLAIIAFVIACFYWTYAIGEDARTALLKQQRDDVFDHIAVQPQPFGFGRVNSVDVSIVNGGHASLDKHRAQCVVYAEWNGDSSGYGRSLALGPQESLLGLLGGGRGETVKCPLLMTMDSPIKCSDMAFLVFFTVEGQPNFPMIKKYRFSFGRIGWIQQDIDLPGDACEGRPEDSQ